MKRYKLLKDLPTFKAGQLAYISEQGNLIAGNPDKPEITDARTKLMMYHRTTLDKFPEILTEWFEEIEEPTDSIHWKPQRGDNYWIAYSDGEVSKCYWNGCSVDIARYEMGRTYRTKEECEKAYKRELAEVRLRRTSNFKPDFENGNGGWIIGYNYYYGELTYDSIDCTDYGEPVRYETEEEAEKSIKENREDWLIYFGVEEKK